MEKGRFRTVVSPDWSINTVPNGGYLMALAVNAMARVATRPMASIVTMAFLSRCHPGDAFIEVDVMAESTRFERIQAGLFQDGQKRLNVFGTFSSAPEKQEFRRYEIDPPEVPEPEKCIKMPAMPGYSLYDQMEVRIDPDCAGWITGSSLSDRSEHRGWIRFKTPRELDEASIVLMADAFPPPVFASQGMVAWVPTLEFTVNLRTIPRGPWIKAVFRTCFITGDMIEEDGQLWSAEGELIAVSRQVAQYRR